MEQNLDPAGRDRRMGLLAGRDSPAATCTADAVIAWRRVGPDDGHRQHLQIGSLSRSSGRCRRSQFTVSGDLRITNKAAHYFYRRWLPASGFRIAGIAGFERFEGNPAEIPYESLKRTIHIPIEPTTQP